MLNTTWLLVFLCVSTACSGSINQTQETWVSTPAKGSPASDTQSMTSPASVEVSISSNSTEEGSPETLAESDQSVAAIEGDILIPENRNAVKTLWGKATVLYTIEEDLAYRESDIKKAFHMISSATCIQFKPRRNELTYLRLKRGKWCASHVGCHGGPQLLLISDSCKVGNICHEIIHALGMHHEHTRKDRERYISINWHNIIRGKERNFKVKYGNTLNLPYDVSSIMHYGPYFFSKRGKPVLQALKGGKDMGQRSHLTKLDAQKLRTLYKCANRHRQV